MAQLTITRRNGDQHVVKYDDEDRGLVEGRAWALHTQGYAYNSTSSTLMHRLIAEAPAGMEVDHINGDKLDNRRENLRVVTHAQNAQAYWPARSANGHRGVTWNKRDQKWQAGAHHQGRYYAAGKFDDLEEAARAALAKRRELFGDHAQ